MRKIDRAISCSSLLPVLSSSAMEAIQPFVLQMEILAASISHRSCKINSAYLENLVSFRKGISLETMESREKTSPRRSLSDEKLWRILRAEPWMPQDWEERASDIEARPPEAVIFGLQRDCKESTSMIESASSWTSPDESRRYTS